jgi:hypothetical protein
VVARLGATLRLAWLRRVARLGATLRLAWLRLG